MDCAALLKPACLSGLLEAPLCSTGEEPLSIYALAENLGINAEIHATDIDTQALEKFRNGKYERNAFRTDGTRYHDLVKNLGSMSEDVLTIEKKHISSINIMRINLNNPDSIPFFAEYFDMIFLRNVFIYFQEEVNQISDSEESSEE